MGKEEPMKKPGNRIRTWIAARPLSAVVVLAAAVLVAASLAAQTSLSDLWIRFSDGTVQTTAAHNCFNPADPADEMIRVGGVCIDKYEASVWSEPTGGTQYGIDFNDYPCGGNGQDCFGKIYARSVEGVQPSRFITWSQAAAALANSGKRLPHNIEWQMGVAGTPDDTNCNVSTDSVSDTGEFVNCVSNWGAHDMVGNLWEWVADWGPNIVCSTWLEVGDDTAAVLCGQGDTTSTGPPAALYRGGDFNSGTGAGPFAIASDLRPTVSASVMGFRGAR